MNVLEMMKGQVIKSCTGLEKNSEEVVINLQSGDIVTFFHAQSCCESVWLEDFESPKSLIGATIIELYTSILGRFCSRISNFISVAEDV